MTRHGSESGTRTTAELETPVLEGLLETESRDPKPTVVMQRDHLLGLVDATTTPEVSANAIPRAVLQRRAKLSSATPRAEDAGDVAAENVDTELAPETSSLVAFAIVAMLIAVFVTVVQLR